MIYIVHPLYDDAAPLLHQWGDGIPEFCINQKFVFADELQSDNSLPPAFVEHMREAASVFNPARDFFVLSGDLMQVTQFTAMLAALYPEFTVLKYDRRENAYIPVLIRSGIVPPPAAVVGSPSRSGNEGTGYGKDSEKGIDPHEITDEAHFPRFPKGFHTA